MSFIDDYLEWKNDRERIAAESRSARGTKSKQQSAAIMEQLELHDVGFVETNGYWFRFTLDGIHVSFVNQGTRFCVTMHRKAQGVYEAVVLADAVYLKGTHLWDAFMEEFLYESFIMDVEFRSIPLAIGYLVKYAKKTAQVLKKKNR